MNSPAVIGSRGSRLPSLAAGLLSLCAFWPQAVWAMPVQLTGRWFQAPPDWVYQGQPGLEEQRQLVPVAHPANTGGNFLFQADFEVRVDGTLVVDFKNSSVIGQFRHVVLDGAGRAVAEMEGGIRSDAESPFFLRHGRELRLTPGRYRLVSQLSSPFFLAQPAPYLDTLRHYRQAIKAGNALTLAALGIFIGLGIYYAALALVRRRVAEGMYAFFIFCNLLYNGTALLVFPDLFGLRWFYLISFPILFSNAAYVVFVLALLEIRPSGNPRLYRMGLGLLALLGFFILLAAAMPHWSLELDRYGVALFLTFGLIAGLVRTRDGHASARLYLVAISAFFLLGGIAVTSAELSGTYAQTVEHVGLAAVAVEAVLLALVLSHQFAQLLREKEYTLLQLEQSRRLAQTDPLTGLPNRYALEMALAKCRGASSLTFLDIDGLKYYNDTYGHDRGDELLRCFADALRDKLAAHATLHRLGGDEFAITCVTGDVAMVEAAIQAAVEALHASGFEFSGTSHGSAYAHEAPMREKLMHLADTRMYEQKHRRKQGVSGSG